jgi:DNA repair protein RecN (Recombination protein N)
LSEQRQQAAENLAQRISQNIQQLGMPNGQFKISIHRHANTQPTAHGIDHVTFLISANLGQDPKPLHKVASGGELSRISLAIQVVNALGNGVPVLVFDEVDVGIGGSVAEIVGQQLAQLAQQRQVIGITHLPQVACCGQQHLKVIKTQQKQQTCSKIEPLQQNQRIEEIARMLGGQVITEQTLAHATEMLRVKML